MQEFNLTSLFDNIICNRPYPLIIDIKDGDISSSFRQDQCGSPAYARSSACDHGCLTV
jgi:hypothetical protein